MNRRDFLMFRSEGGRRIARLSCQQLYMVFTDSVSMSRTNAVPRSRSEGEWWQSEPEAELHGVAPERIFQDAADEIAGVDVVVVEDEGWLSDEAFRSKVTALLDGYASGGGEVRFATRPGSGVV